MIMLLLVAWFTISSTDTSYRTKTYPFCLKLSFITGVTSSGLP